MCIDCPTKRDRLRSAAEALVAETSLFLVMVVSVVIVAVAAFQMRIV